MPVSCFKSCASWIQLRCFKRGTWRSFLVALPAKFEYLWLVWKTADVSKRLESQSMPAKLPIQRGQSASEADLHPRKAVRHEATVFVQGLLRLQVYESRALDPHRSGTMRIISATTENIQARLCRSKAWRMGLLQQSCMHRSGGKTPPRRPKHSQRSFLGFGYGGWRPRADRGSIYPTSPMM